MLTKSLVILFLFYVFSLSFGKHLPKDHSTEKIEEHLDHKFLEKFLFGLIGKLDKFHDDSKETLLAKRSDHEEDNLWLYRLLLPYQNEASSTKTKPRYKKTYPHETMHQSVFHKYFPNFVKHIYDCLDIHE